IPGRARPKLHWQHRVVRVQPGGVGGGGEALEYVALAIGRIGEERQHLIPMAGEHDLVESLRRSIAKRQRDSVLASAHRLNRYAWVNVVVRERRDELGNVGVAAPGHDLPRRLLRQRE